MDLRNLALGGAALGILTACWDYLKSFAWRLVSLFIRRVEIPSEAAHQALIAYLVANHPRWRNYDSMYGADFEHMRNGRYGLVPYEQFGNRSVIFWSGWFPFVFNNAQESKPRAGQPHGDSSGGPKNPQGGVRLLQRPDLGGQLGRGEGQEPLRHPPRARPQGGGR